MSWKVGVLEVALLRLGIASFDALMKSGGYEYSRHTDQAPRVAVVCIFVGLRGQEAALLGSQDVPGGQPEVAGLAWLRARARRIDLTLQKFQNKYPDQPDLEDPRLGTRALEFWVALGPATSTPRSSSHTGRWGTSIEAPWETAWVSF